MQREKGLLWQEDLEKVKLHTWYMRLAWLLTRFLSLPWSDIPYLTDFRWRFNFCHVGMHILETLYLLLISAYSMELQQLCFSFLAFRNERLFLK